MGSQQNNVTAVTLGLFDNADDGEENNKPCSINAHSTRIFRNGDDSVHSAAMSRKLLMVPRKLNTIADNKTDFHQLCRENALAMQQLSMATQIETFTPKIKPVRQLVVKRRNSILKSAKIVLSDVLTKSLLAVDMRRWQLRPARNLSTADEY